MRACYLLPLVLALAACGVETAGTAATAASLKKREIEQGRAALDRFDGQLDQARQAMQQRAAGADDGK